jgi:hypothetical protein
MRSWRNADEVGRIRVDKRRRRRSGASMAAGKGDVMVAYAIFDKKARPCP